MYKKNWVMPWLAALTLTACGSREVQTVKTMLDEPVALSRGERSDVATRELRVDDDSIVVVNVDEQSTDIGLTVRVTDGDDVLQSVSVENNLLGYGHEIAALAAPDGSRIVVTMTGPQSAAAPGRVALRVDVFDAGARRSPKFAASIIGYESWTKATNAAFHSDSIRALSLAEMERAIANFATPNGDAALAAQARLVKANMLQFFQLDSREARAEAQRAGAAFAALPASDAPGIARAKYVEALALIEIGADRASVNPTADEANALARDMLTELGGPASALAPLERALALQALGELSGRLEKLDEANKYFEAALAIYQEARFAAGIAETRASLASVLVERGMFADGARAYDEVLSTIDKVRNSYGRIEHQINAGRGLVYAGRTDEAAELLLKALRQTREFKMRSLEGRALHGLGYLYHSRSDFLQARTYLTEVVKLARDRPGTMEYVWALTSAGVVARNEGDTKAAIEMHQEAVGRASTPIGKVRTLHDLGLDYFFAMDYPAAEDAFRKALAVKLDDPRHHAYTDVKRNLAVVLVEQGDGSPATLAEAGKLLAEALETCVRVHDALRELMNHRVSGELRAAQGRFSEARAEFERTFEMARAQRQRSANSDARTATLAPEQAAIRGYIDLLLRTVAAQGAGTARAASRAEADALRRIELVRDATLDTARAVQLDAATNASVDALLGQMAHKSLEISAMLRPNLPPADEAKLGALQLEMSNLHAEIDRLRTAAAHKSPTESVRPANARTWRALAPGVVQLSYALGNEHAYAWIRTAAGVRVALLALPPGELERALAELGTLDRQAEPEKVERAIESISAVLLPPGLLPSNASSVEVLAEGRIAGVPFPALRSPADARRRLVETHSVTMISSMFDVDEAPRPKQARPFRFVALASGNGTLRAATVADPVPKLQAATKEARIVADLFAQREPGARIKLLLGPEGSAAALRGILGSGVDVVHFATHALADLRQPLASLLVLPATNARGEATYLTAGQVREWRGDAELVFLSACESAIGPPRFAAGMPGLQSAFLRAGARGVIATLWPIEDLLAQEFSADFYERFTRGVPAALALSETQRAWIEAKAGAGGAAQMRRRITALAHAYYVR